MEPASPLIKALIVAIPETAGSALYGMVDVLSSAGNLWQELAGGDKSHPFQPHIVSPTRDPFLCGNGIPVQPDYGIDNAPQADIVILPELWLGPDEDFRDRYPALFNWIRDCYQAGSTLYSACSGSVMLAATGLLDNKEATSHWGYQDLFRTQYPDVRFRPEPNLCFADPQGRIVTAGGTTSWHDLAIHIIARHCSAGEAMRIAKVYLLKWHGEGQLPYAPLARKRFHADAVVRRCEDWLADNFQRHDAVAKVIAFAGLPERSMKRRFKAATGTTLISHVQNLRVEQAKRRLETETITFEQIAAELGYDNLAFFRRIFKRATGLTPGAYRRMFRPITEAEREAARSGF